MVCCGDIEVPVELGIVEELMFANEAYGVGDH